MSAKKRLLVGTLFLLLAGGAVAGGALYLHRSDEAAEAAAAEASRLVPADFPEVERITLLRQTEDGAEEIRLARGSEGWRIEAPVQAPAAPEEVEGLLSRVRAARSKGEVARGAAADARLEEYGLSPPRVSLTLEGGGRTLRIDAGRKTPYDETLFVRTTSAGVTGPILRVDGALEFPLEKSVFVFRERHVFPMAPEDVEAVEVTAVDPPYRLVREGDVWRLETPVRDRADEATVQKILDTLDRLQAIEFAPALPAGEPLGTIRLGLKGGGEQVLDLYGVKDGDLMRLWSRGPLGVAQVQADALRRLEFTDFDLRWKRLLDLDRTKVRRIVVRRGKAHFALEREGEAWWIVEPERKKAADWKVSAGLYALEQLRAERFYDGDEAPAALGLDPPKWRIELFVGKEPLGRLAIGNTAPSIVDPLRYAQGTAEDRISIVRERDLKELPRSIAQLTDASPPSPH